MSVHRAGPPLVLCLLAVLTIAPGAPAQPAGIEAIEKQLGEMAREVGQLEAAVAAEKKEGRVVRAELKLVRDYLTGELGRVVEFPVDPRRSEFPPRTPDAAKIRSAISDVYNELLRVDLVVPGAAFSDDEAGGVSSPLSGGRLRVRYLPGGVIPSRKSQTLMRVLVHLREVTQRMETDIRNLVVSWAELEGRTTAEIRDLNKKLESATRKLEHRDGRIKELEAENEKLKAAIRLLKGDR